MTDDARLEKIEQLSNMPPLPKLSRRERAYRVMAWLTAAVALGAFGIAYDAAMKSAAVAQCTNTNLGERDQANQADRAAQDRVIGADGTVATTMTRFLVVLIRTQDKHERLDAYQALVRAETDDATAHATYRKVRAAADAARAAHPIGKC